MVTSVARCIIHLHEITTVVQDGFCIQVCTDVFPLEICYALLYTCPKMPQCCAQNMCSLMGKRFHPKSTSVVFVISHTCQFRIASALMRGTSDFNQQPFPSPPKTCFSLQWLGTVWGGKRSVFSRFCLVCYIKIPPILRSVLCLVCIRIIKRAKYNLVLRSHQKN